MPAPGACRDARLSEMGYGCFGGWFAFAVPPALERVAEVWVPHGVGPSKAS